MENKDILIGIGVGILATTLTFKVSGTINKKKEQKWIGKLEHAESGDEIYVLVQASDRVKAGINARIIIKEGLNEDFDIVDIKQI
jgi:hypothetical protein